MKNNPMKQIFTFLAAALLAVTTYAQVGIGTTTPNASAALDITSTTRGFLPPRLTYDQINAITNLTEGLMVYCTDCTTKGLYVYNASFWQSVSYPDKSLSLDVTSATGKIWMDRNLGASRVATSSTDSEAYGDLYQWGRNSDGHQTRTSGTVAGPVESGAEGSNFIQSQGDWLSSSDDDRWNGASKGVHDPCPDGYRVPTSTEWDNERNNGGPGSWGTGSVQNNAAGAYASVLKLPVAGHRSNINGVLGLVGNNGNYWSSTVSGTFAVYQLFDSNYAGVSVSNRAAGLSVRCIKE